MMLRDAQVVAVHPKSRTVDLVYLDTREPVRGVRVAGKASSVSGSWDVPDMPRPATAQATGQISATGRSMIALVGQLRGRPVVVGFLPGKGNSVAFTDPDRQVELHPSGVYSSTDAAGNLQLGFPGGLTIRVGTPAVENLADVSADGNWAPLSGGTPPFVTLACPKFTLTVDMATGNLTMNSQGSATLTTTGAATVTAGTSASVLAPMVTLGVAGAAKRVVVDGDPVVGGKVAAMQNTHVFAA